MCHLVTRLLITLRRTKTCWWWQLIRAGATYRRKDHPKARNAWTISRLAAFIDQCGCELCRRYLLATYLPNPCKCWSHRVGSRSFVPSTPPKRGTRHFRLKPCSRTEVGRFRKLKRRLK